MKHESVHDHEPAVAAPWTDMEELKAAAEAGNEFAQRVLAEKMRMMINGEHPQRT